MKGTAWAPAFCKHVERTDLFLHLVDLSALQEGDPLENFAMINRELARHNPEMAKKPQIVVLTKMDITEVRERAADILPIFTSQGYPVFSLSAVTGTGMAELVSFIGRKLEERLQRSDAGCLDKPTDQG